MTWTIASVTFICGGCGLRVVDQQDPPVSLEHAAERLSLIKMRCPNCATTAHLLEETP